MALARLPRSFDHVRQQAMVQCKTMTIDDLMRSSKSDSASLRTAARWLHEQLPIRFARRIEGFMKLPHVVVADARISSVLRTYVESFDVLHEFRSIETEADEEDFLRVIEDLVEKHRPGTELIAEGYKEVRRLYPEMRLDQFLHDHFTMRIATSILMDNYVEQRNPRPHFVGVVCQDMRPVDIVNDIVDVVSELTQSIYGIAPRVEFRGNEDCVLDYIPRHVKYMVMESLKNAFRSTVERHIRKNGNAEVDLPPVVVEFQQGDVHVIIKVSDQGGGMKKHMQQEAWQYGWTTGGRPGDGQKRLSGFGFGLPLTKLFARYFGGDVFMQALPGHGTDIYLILTHLKEGSPATMNDDLSTLLYNKENAVASNSLSGPFH